MNNLTCNTRLWMLIRYYYYYYYYCYDYFYCCYLNYYYSYYDYFHYYYYTVGSWCQDTLGCEHYCISTSRGAQCACYAGFMLGRDSKSCRSECETFLKH